MLREKLSASPLLPSYNHMQTFDHDSDDDGDDDYDDDYDDDDDGDDGGDDDDDDDDVFLQVHEQYAGQEDEWRHELRVRIKTFSIQILFGVFLSK